MGFGNFGGPILGSFFIDLFSTDTYVQILSKYFDLFFFMKFQIFEKFFRNHTDMQL